MCYIIFTKARAFYGKDFIRLPRQYMNTNGILLEPQRLFGFLILDLHHFYTTCKY